MPESEAGKPVRPATGGAPAVSRSVRRRLATRGAVPVPARPHQPPPAPAPAAEEPAASAPAGDSAGAETRPDERRPDEGRPDEGRPDEGRPDEGRPDERRMRRWRLAIAGLSVLLAAALAATGLIGRDLHDKRQIEAAHQQALATARQAAVNFLSISAATVDSDIQRIATGATGDFRDEFTRDAAQVRSAVTQNKVASQGTVLRTGLVSGDTRNAVVLVAVDATVKNKGAPNGRLSHYRLRVGLARDPQSRRWLVSQLQFVG